MTAAGSIDLDRLIDDRRVDARLLLWVLVATLVLVSDGFDLAAVGYLAPELAHEWGLSARAFVPAFSAGIIGMMIGGPLLGWLGDRLGRKRLIVAGLVAIGLFTLLTMAARATVQLAALRFLTGVALGGVIPNVGALIAELSPKRARGRLLVVVTLGVPIGIALPGLVAATLVPGFGWRAILLVGGVLPLLVALAAAAALPESLKYLLARGDRAAANLTAARLSPDLVTGGDVTVRLAAAAVPARLGSFRALFAGDLAVVTALLWLCQAANQMANFFALTWLPTLLQAGGAAPMLERPRRSSRSGGWRAGSCCCSFSIGPG